MEEAFIAAAEKDDIITEEMAAAIRGGARPAAGAVGVDVLAVDISEALFLDEDDDSADEDYEDDGEDDDL